MKCYSLKQIADSIGVNKVTVYQHYQHLKQSRGAKFTNHVKSDNKILLDNFAYELILKSFKKINKNNTLILMKSYQSRINDLKNEVKNLRQDKQDLKHYLNQSQELERTTQLKLAKPVTEHSKTHGFWYRLKNFFK